MNLLLIELFLFPAEISADQFAGTSHSSSQTVLVGLVLEKHLGSRVSLRKRTEPGGTSETHCVFGGAQEGVVIWCRCRNGTIGVDSFMPGSLGQLETYLIRLYCHFYQFVKTQFKTNSSQPAGGTSKAWWLCTGERS